MDLGKAIKTCRIQKNMKQADLAKESAISVSYLSLLEKGKRTPNFSVLEKISQALRVPLSILVFLAFDREEMDDLSPDISEKLSHAVLKLLKSS